MTWACTYTWKMFMSLCKYNLNNSEEEKGYNLNQYEVTNKFLVSKCHNTQTQLCPKQKNISKEIEIPISSFPNITFNCFSSKLT